MKTITNERARLLLGIHLIGEGALALQGVEFGSVLSAGSWGEEELGDQLANVREANRRWRELRALVTPEFMEAALRQNGYTDCAMTQARLVGISDEGTSLRVEVEFEKEDEEGGHGGTLWLAHTAGHWLAEF